eukprot:CAMPEP_0117066098 /NCGR_PEP_ID=MMETSP0472-20121206/46233_1 /TAXON_ID=693140 ORGANISM="Tiarina fusus, Strain LIS" /NCGR_SAMPLE_ID=MMETSP0472 /ASSEMBLY_ACC=CAM_ASM_000603 /LENGTH=153 /DNA_ID=CAMNT_0004787037 /DNA_START=220 /DNA_END=681 /DNA_ORIENTATION=-
MAATVSIEGNRLHCALIGSVGIFVIRAGLIQFELRGEGENYFFPPLLQQFGNLDQVVTGSTEIQHNDAIVVVNEGILDNVEKQILVEKVMVGDRHDKNKAKMLTQIASQISLGIAPTPFSVEAQKVGFTWEGGRVGDMSAMLFVTTPRFQENQ